MFKNNFDCAEVATSPRNSAELEKDQSRRSKDWYQQLPFYPTHQHKI